MNFGHVCYTLDACVVLVRDSAGIPQHLHRGYRALQPAGLAHGVSV